MTYTFCYKMSLPEEENLEKENHAVKSGEGTAALIHFSPIKLIK